MRPVQDYRKASKGDNVFEIKYKSATCFHYKNIALGSADRSFSNRSILCRTWKIITLFCHC